MATVFAVPFANSGDKVEIPSAIQTNGKVSFEEGFGKDYEKALLTDADAKNIERKKLNYLFNLFCLKMNTLGLSIDDLDAKINALTLPIGVPFPYPLATPPDSKHLKCNGSIFDTAVYTKLATMYPDGKTPDLRAEFIRGWDDGKGIDSGRELLSAQNALVGSHIHNLAKLWSQSDESGYPGKHLGFATRIHNTTLATMGNGILEDVDTALGIAVGYGNGGHFTSRASVLSNNNSADNRPRNISFNYIMRAI